MKSVDHELHRLIPAYILLEHALVPEYVRPEPMSIDRLFST